MKITYAIGDMNFYSFNEGDKVQLRPDFEKLIMENVISEECGYVSVMDKLIGKELTVSSKPSGLENHKGRKVYHLKIEECPDYFTYNSEWLIPWEDEQIAKLKGESTKL